jgi:hypothetical protein
VFDNEAIVGMPLSDEEGNGLYFIEHGIITVERDPNQRLTSLLHHSSGIFTSDITADILSSTIISSDPLSNHF